MKAMFVQGAKAGAKEIGKMGDYAGEAGIPIDFMKKAL